MSDEQWTEHMRLVYIIEGLQDEIQATCESLEQYRQRDRYLKHQLALARVTLAREARQWLIHGLGLGVCLGFVIAWLTCAK